MRAAFLPAGDEGVKLSPTKSVVLPRRSHMVQELCESRGGRPELSVLTSHLISVDVTLY